MSSSVNITFNGEPRSVNSSSIAELLAEFNLQNRRVAVELNRQIVPRDRYAETGIRAGDSIEIVHFVGGG